jgi:chemotaxis protein MotB
VSKDKGKKVIVVRKKKGGGHGHHGGAWKVAYADFVTAMMAFFMVMWILGMDDSAKQAVEGYFSNPVGYKKGYSSGNSPIASGNSPGQLQAPSSVRLIMRAYEQERLEATAGSIRTRVAEAGALRSLAAQVEVVVTEQGLRIELVEGGDGQTFFALGSADLKGPAREVLVMIAEELVPLGNPLVIEGHTDSAQFGSSGYTNWELSADRANAARRVMERAGIVATRVAEVRGHADRHPRVTDDPLHPANRRISILLPFTTDAPDPDFTIREDAV